MTLIDDYFVLQEKYEKKYGEKTIVLMECGQFFEIYGIKNDLEKKGRIYEISDITNLSVSKRGGDKTKQSCRKNPLMSGFPNHSYDKWKDILLKHNYTIIKIEQDSHGTKDPTRKVTEIISPGVNIYTNMSSNNLLSLYIEEIICKKTGKKMLYAGASQIDVSTGSNTIYEIIGKPDDSKYTLDELFRFVQTYNPQEILINTVNLSYSKDYLINYLELHNNTVHYDYYKDSDILQNKFREAILNKLFPNHGMISVYDYLGIERLIWGTNSYIFLLQFTYEHNETILQKLIIPKIWTNNHNLILSYDSMNQLNVIPNNKSVTGIDSLWTLINNTKTCMGTRLFKNTLLNPIINKHELNNRYDLIEQLQENKLYLSISHKLEKIFDIEKLHRKMTIGVLQPSSFINLDISYKYILEIIDDLTTSGNNKLISLLPDKNTVSNFKNLIEDYENIFKMDILNNVSQNTMKLSIFKRGVYSEIDSLQDKIDDYKSFFSNLGQGISNIIPSNKDKKNIIDVRQTDRDGYFLTTTKKRANDFKKASQNIDKINLILDKSGKKIDVNISDLEIKISNQVAKITGGLINNYAEGLHFNLLKMSRLCLLQFLEVISDFDKKYSNILKNIVEFIAFLDMITSNTISSIDNCYKRPTIIDKYNSKSYFNCTSLRHPIIEKINTKTQYIPNDMELGSDKIGGILLYGTNAVGKSSLMKSIGLAIIMAQSGMFVAANSFEYYPYKDLFTRISGNDNIFRGQSTFAVEMSELRSILRRSDKNSLVLGDELCSGTETVSGLAIVSAGVVTLNNLNSSFIFATHLHQLSKLEELEQLTKVKNFHMETIYNSEKDILIYNRKLKEGPGNAIYGLEVAKAMDLSPDFIKLANKFRKKVLNINNNIIGNKVSQYNSEVVIDKCQICGDKTEDIHHIKHQKDADHNNIIDNHHKNILHNLIQVCHGCHHKAHNGLLEILGYVDSSNGIIVNYKETSQDIKLKRRKFNDTEIEIIKTYKGVAGMSKIKSLLELKHKIKTSVSTIKKILNDTYI